jgi:hypothetical protein
MKNRFFTPLFLIAFLFSSLILFSVSSEAVDGPRSCKKDAAVEAILVTTGVDNPFILKGTTTAIDQCAEEPDEYKVKFYSVALCLTEPYTAGGAAPDFSSCTTILDTTKEVNLKPGVDVNLLDGEINLPLGSYTHLAIIIDNHLKIKHKQKYVLASDKTTAATIFGNTSGSGQFCWTVAAGITTYTNETYDSAYATAQGITPVTSGQTASTARLKCGSAVPSGFDASTDATYFATEIIDHMGDDATFVGYADYGSITVEADTGITDIEIAANMLTTTNTLASTEDESRRISQIYKYDTPIIIAENTNSFKLKVTTYASVSIDMSVDNSNVIWGAKVGGDPFIIEVETETGE